MAIVKQLSKKYWYSRNRRSGYVVVHRATPLLPHDYAHLWIFPQIITLTDEHVHNQ